MTNEMLLVISVALCFLMVVFANAVGFSPALGAFIMGSILAETTKAEKIEHLISPVKDLFGAIFFVSVGMLIDPAVLVQYALPIIILCVVTVIGKVFSTTLGALLSGQPLQTSVQAGFSLAQIGEFSFIIATLGLTLGVTSDFLYPIAVAVSAVTTLTTPYLITSSAGFHHWLTEHLPPGFIRRINEYSSETKKISHFSKWKVFLRSTIINTVLLSIVIVALIFFASQYALPWINREGASLALKIGTALLTLALLLPFLWALGIKGPSENSSSIVADSRYRGLLLMVRFFKLGLAAFYIGFLLHRFFNLYTGVTVTALMIILMVVFSKNIKEFYTRIEGRFLNNLNQREIDNSKKNRLELAPWDAHITSVEVASNALCVGKSLLDLQWREKMGVNVVLIKRGDDHFPAPGKEVVIFPGDELLVLGTDAQILRLRSATRSQKRKEEDADFSGVALHQYVIDEDSPVKGLTIRETGLREKAGALVVGIERNEERILNPESDLKLNVGDILFVVGNKTQLMQVFNPDSFVTLQAVP